MSAAKLTRRGPGMYTATLPSGAEATVSRDNACEGDTGRGLWQWDDQAGGCGGFATRRKAVDSLEEYRE